MRITRRFVWGDNRADEYEEILSPTVDRLVTRGGTPFYLRHWEIRYAPGSRVSPKRSTNSGFNASSG
jgi:hypothetical protein